MMASKIILKGGILLIHDEYNHVIPTKADLLVEDDRISAIRASIEQADHTGAIVINCADTVVAPGFIDTHHHLWQSQRKGLHCDQILLDYYHSGNLASSFFGPEDVFWGQLAGALECVDAGTTTVVDHAHLNYSPEHSKNAIRATISSGIRSIFCYCAHPRVASWQPELTFHDEWFPDWIMKTFRELAALQPFGPNGRVGLGFAVDSGLLPPPKMTEIFQEVRALGARLITSHVVHMSMMDNQGPSAVEIMATNHLLGPDLLLSHANATTREDLSHLIRAGTHLSSTPLIEMQMGHGKPICLQPEFLNISSLGVDCHSVCNSYLPSQMLTVLQSSRAGRFAEMVAQKQWDATVGPTVEDVYNLGTILGARAIGMEKDVGSLKVGKKADIVIFDGRSPSMLSVSEHHPVTAIVMHSSVRDVRTVIIDGIVRKERSTLMPVSIPTGNSSSVSEDNETVAWDRIALELEKSRSALDLKVEEVDEEVARNGLIKWFLEAMSKVGINS